MIFSRDPSYSARSVPEEVLPLEALIWAKNAEDLRTIKRISAYVTEGGTISGTGDDGQSFSRIYHDVCGARFEYVPDCKQPKRFVGIGKEVWDDDTGGDWEEDNMVHFEIDGPGGEVVTRVEVAMHENPKAMKVRAIGSSALVVAAELLKQLFTNRGRETYWGEQKVENWRVLEVPQGETVVGLVFAFGQPSGWNNETKTNVSEVFF